MDGLIPVKHRRSLRLPAYDYSQPGGYFLTICVQDRLCLMGHIRDGELIPSDAGRMVSRWWLEIQHKYLNIEIDHFVVMPNHFHGILMIHDVPVGADLRVRPGADTQVGPYVRPAIPTIVQWFKTMTTNEYIGGVK